MKRVDDGDDDKDENESTPAIEWAHPVVSMWILHCINLALVRI